MTWRIFMKNIQSSNIASGTSAQILIELFQSAGCIIKKEDGISESAAKTWINGNRKCRVSSYFPNNKLENPKGAYNFFRRRPREKLKDLQRAFREISDKDSPIDCETENLDMFCWSLVNQFLDLLGLQRLDLSAEDTTSNKSVVENNKMAVNSNDNTDEDFNNTIDEIAITVEGAVCGNTYAEQSLITSPIENVNQQKPQNKNAISQIDIPKNCRVCCCCKNWKDDTGVQLENIEDKYGECMVYGKKVLSTEGDNCDKFREDGLKVILYQINRKK